MMHESVDHAFGALAYLRQQRIRGLENSHPRMAYYERLPREVLFPDPDKPKPPRKGRSFKLLGVDCQNLVFESTHAPLHPDEIDRYFAEYSALHTFFVRRVRNTVSGEKPRRACVYLHAWMVAGAEIADASFAAVLSKQLDCDVFNIQQVHHGRRQIPRSIYHGVHFFSADLVMTFESIRQAVIDARTVVQYLLASGEYDEVGLVGVSLGAAMATITSCFEPDLSWAVPIVGHIDIADAVEHAPVAAFSRRKLRDWGVTMEELKRLNDVLATGWLTPALEHKRLLLVPGVHDTCMRADAVRRQLARWPEAQVMWLEGGHITGLLTLKWRFPEIRAFIDSLPPVQRRFGETMPPQHAPA
jgi:hypothetical protein